jgi:hypothetical protein
MVPEIKKILFTTDLSKESRFAFDYAEKHWPSSGKKPKKISWNLNLQWTKLWLCEKTWSMRSSVKCKTEIAI